MDRNYDREAAGKGNIQNDSRLSNLVAAALSIISTHRKEGPQTEQQLSMVCNVPLHAVLTDLCTVSNMAAGFLRSANGRVGVADSANGGCKG